MNNSTIYSASKAKTSGTPDTRDTVDGNAVKVHYKVPVEEPVVKPTLTRSYYKGEVNTYKSTAGNTTTRYVYFTDRNPTDY